MPPVVGPDDQVAQPNTEGMTPAEAQAAMEEFQERVMANARRIVNEARNAPIAPTAPIVNPTDVVTREEFNRITASAQAGLVAMAQMTASTGKSDWAQLFPKVKAIVDQFPAEQQINSDVWTEAYYNVRGRMTDELVEAGRRSALGLEAPAPPPAAPEKPRVFADDELSIVNGLGITTEMYADAEKKIETRFQPFTTDNRRGRAGK